MQKYEPTYRPPYTLLYKNVFKMDNRPKRKMQYYKLLEENIREKSI